MNGIFPFLIGVAVGMFIFVSMSWKRPRKLSI